MREDWGTASTKISNNQWVSMTIRETQSESANITSGTSGFSKKPFLFNRSVPSAGPRTSSERCAVKRSYAYWRPSGESNTAALLITICAWMKATGKTGMHFKFCYWKDGRQKGQEVLSFKSRYGIRNGKHIRSTTIAWKLKQVSFGSALRLLGNVRSKLVRTALKLQQRHMVRCSWHLCYRKMATVAW